MSGAGVCVNDVGDGCQVEVEDHRTRKKKSIKDEFNKYGKHYAISLTRNQRAGKFVVVRRYKRRCFI